jgi:hypothetical protein
MVEVGTRTAASQPTATSLWISMTTRHLSETYRQKNHQRTFYGLGSGTGPVDVDVRTPGGNRWQWHGLPADRLHELDLSESNSVAKSR